MSEPKRNRWQQGTQGIAASVTALAAGRVLGANERVRLGFIGVGNRGGQLLTAFLEHADMEVAAVCDIDRNYLDQAHARLEGRPDRLSDFRKLIDRKDIDAVVIATPDHWHAIQMIAACDAGKDVYVEKPLSVTVVEGRRMVEAARRNNRIVQVGTHRRSSALFRELHDLIAAGRLGKVTLSRAYRLSNMWPTGMGKASPSDPPAHLDWDTWLGPRPMRTYQENIAPYKFRWWQLYSSQAANWGVHYCDAIRWLTDEVAPQSVCAIGGKFAVDDDRTVPDTMQCTYQFASGRLAIFGQWEASGNRALPKEEVELRGTLGTAYIEERRFEIVPERGGQFQDRAPRAEPLLRQVEAKDSNAELTAQHARNFLDCVKSRAMPNADVEEGHRSTTFSHLANISLATRSRLEWDAQAERITSPTSANDLLHYEYRAPWKLG